MFIILFIIIFFAAIYSNIYYSSLSCSILIKSYKIIDLCLSLPFTIQEFVVKSRAPVNGAAGGAVNVAHVVVPVAVQVRQDDDMHVVDEIRRPVELSVGAKKPRLGQQ